MNSAARSASRYGPWLLRLAIFAALWWLLTDGAANAWVIGVIAVPLAAWLSLRLAPQVAPWRLRVSIAGLLQFIPYFVLQSLRGGFDTAWRALQPQQQVAPGFVDYRVQLPAGPAQLLFINVISLLPGTLSAELRGDVVIIHVLSTDTFSLADLQQCEQRVAALFGFDLTQPGSLEESRQ